MRVTMLLLAASLAACAPTALEQERAPSPPHSQALPAPVPAGTSVRIEAEQNGQTVQVRVGERFAVALVGIPTAGYLWAPVATPDFMRKVGEGGGPTTEMQRKPGFTGGNHWEVFEFVADQAGRGELRLEQRRPWETDTPPTQTFSVTIDAQ